MAGEGGGGGPRLVALALFLRVSRQQDAVWREPYSAGHRVLGSEAGGSSPVPPPALHPGPCSRALPTPVFAGPAALPPCPWGPLRTCPQSPLLTCGEEVWTAVAEAGPKLGGVGVPAPLCPTVSRLGELQ